MAAGLLTASAVAVTAWLVGWQPRRLLLAAIGSFVLIVAWRAACNGFQLNQDFLPAISVGDLGCLLFGATPSAAALLVRTSQRLSWLPALVEGLAGFVVNVVIL